MKFIRDLLPILICFGIPAVYILVLHLIRFGSGLKQRPSALTHIVLRAPGQSRVEKIAGFNHDLGLAIALLASVPPVFYAGYLSHLQFYRHLAAPGVVWVLGATGIAITMYYFFKTLKLLKKRRNAQQGYESAMAVAQELNQLVMQGYRVYHDFPADGFHIDHIVVGRSGIFAVETDSRSISGKAGSLHDATVEYNGKMLHFPGEDDYEIIEVAEHKASWLSEWVGIATGEPVAARAIVALPGWFVKRTSADGISVVNPEQFSSLFEHIKPRMLPDSMIDGISHQLQQHYRRAVPVAPKFEETPPVLHESVSDTPLNIEPARCNSDATPSQ